MQLKLVISGHLDISPHPNEPLSLKNSVLLQHTCFVYLQSSAVNFNNFTLFSATPVLINQWLWLQRRVCIPSSSSVAPCALHSLGGKYGYRQRLFGITPLRLCHHSVLVSSLSRRLFLPSVSGTWDALSGGNSASIAVRRGMQLSRQGDVHGSLVEFDKAIGSDPHQKIFGKGDCHCIIWIGLNKAQRNFG